MPTTDTEILFPYMVWAQTRSKLSSASLSQSGMPSASPSLFDGLYFDLGFPRGSRPYLVPLQRDVASPFAKFTLPLLIVSPFFVSVPKFDFERPSRAPMRSLKCAIQAASNGSSISFCMSGWNSSINCFESPESTAL